MKHKTHGTRGFTLIEMTVVLGAIVIIASMSFAVFVSIIGRQKRAIEKGEILIQSNYVFEYMSKAARQAAEDRLGECLGIDNKGAVYLLTRCDAQNNCIGLKFINSEENVCQEFFLDEASSSRGAVLKELKDGLSLPLLSDKFQVKKMRFVLNGEDKTKAAFFSEDNPTATMLLRVGVGYYFNDEDVIIQTTVSARR